MDSKWAPVFHPTREEFSRPFTEYISEIFRQHPDLPCFKVIPPTGWKPRQTPFPDLKTVKINTPIRQHAFGKAGVYRCVLVESKTLTVHEFKRLAEDEVTRAAKHNKRDDSDDCGDSIKERSFWASVTLNPPLYGADTPVSFFDETLPYGWNMRNLGDLLTTRNVPEVPGVTTPMTYFGMWRAFFGWHKEDADLLSVNYMHFGAPKVWYCVSPKHKEKFDRMASSLFPQQAAACGAFIRHKDILISPAQLRAFNIPYMQVRQEEGEFVVLNAAAYHAGYNMGFNCAEAINFATEEWISAGKTANRCRCSALKDAVHISMSLFDPSWKSPDQSEDEEEEDSEDEAAAQERREQLQQRKNARLHALLEHQRLQAMARAAAARQEDGDTTHGQGQEQCAGPVEQPQQEQEQQEAEGGGEQGDEGTPGGKSGLSAVALHLLRVQAATRAKRQRAAAAADDSGEEEAQGSQQRRDTPSSAKTARRGNQATARQQQQAEATPPLAAPLDTAAQEHAEGEAAKAGTLASRRAGRPTSTPAPLSPSPVVPVQLPAAADPAPHDSKQPQETKTAHLPGSRPIRRVQVTKLTRGVPEGHNPTVPVKVTYRWMGPPAKTPAALLSEEQPPLAVSSLPLLPLRKRGRIPESTSEPSGDTPTGQPWAVVWEDETGLRHFKLVQKLLQAFCPGKPHHVRLRVLDQHPDGLYYPTSEVWEKPASSLVAIRTKAVSKPLQLGPSARSEAPAWELLSKAERILGET